MTKTKLNEELFNKIEKNSRIAIFGAGTVGKKILSDMKKFRPDVETVLFIDSFATGKLDGVNIVSLSDLEVHKHRFDKLVFSTQRQTELVKEKLKQMDIDFLSESNFVEIHYRNLHDILSSKNYLKIQTMFESKEDKDLFDLLFMCRLNNSITGLKEYIKKTFGDVESFLKKNYYKQYLDKSLLEKVETAYDLGFYNGANFLAWNETMKNLKKVYAFEAVYDIVKVDFIDKIINESKKVEILSYLVGEKNENCKFIFYKNNPPASCLKEILPPDYTPGSSIVEIDAKVVTLDDLIDSGNLIPPDFIKMDIEGSELSALKGAFETIKKFRPQIAVCIYHSASDFVNIPLWLRKNLTDYTFRLGHYSTDLCETVLYAIPKELC